MAPARPAELEAVMGLLREARSWHQKQGVDMWREFDSARIAADIDAGRVYLARAGDEACGTVTLVESDGLVWGEERGDELYVHKLAVARHLAGRGIGAEMLRWTQRLARERGKRRLRLDTWDGNRKMRAYYERQGFRHVRDQYFAPDSPLPADYRGTHKSLYQLDL
ncbi:MAG TPA: GNAT family N-acetyltransferase [Burkholderiales bacterium]